MVSNVFFLSLSGRDRSSVSFTLASFVLPYPPVVASSSRPRGGKPPCFPPWFEERQRQGKIKEGRERSKEQVVKAGKSKRVRALSEKK